MNQNQRLKFIKKPRSKPIVDKPINFGELENLHLELLEKKVKGSLLYVYLGQQDEEHIMNICSQLGIINKKILTKIQTFGLNFVELTFNRISSSFS